MQCHDCESGANLSGDLEVLLIGNPNVGKSVIFSKLTGREVLTANYSGTTVSYTKGYITYQGNKAVLIDVPGTYSLEATSRAEEVAIKMLDKGADVVVCVLDATNLERNLNFAFQVMQHDIPLVFALNLADVAERQGILIDVKALEKELGAPVVPTVAIRGMGLNELLDKVWQAAAGRYPRVKKAPLQQDKRWQEVGRIIKNVQRVEHRHPTFWDRVGDMTLQPFPGLPIAFLVLLTSMALVVGGGKALRSLILLPLVNDYYAPFITSLVSRFVNEGVILNVLVGEYGVLIKGVEWPFALILPYVLLFYIAISYLEDSGFLPRLAVLVDGVLFRIGIPGSSIVPFIMGYGCAVPAILGTRAATSYKERLMVAGVVSLAVPCVAQTGAFISLLGDRSVIVLMLMFFTSFVAIILAGIILNKIIPGKVDHMLLEIPNLLKPNAEALFKKLWIRLKHFFFEAEVPLLLGIILAALLVETRFLYVISGQIEFLVVGWLGMPAEASLALMLGIIRRELGVLPLLELDLTTLQLFVGSLVALFYLPCLSAFAVLIKEFGSKIAFGIGLFSIFIAFFIGGMVNQVVSLIISLI